MINNEKKKKQSPNLLGIIKANEKVKSMIKAFISLPPKQNTQVTVNLSSTPLHGEMMWCRIFSAMDST